MLGTEKRDIKQLRWRRQNLLPTSVNRYGSFWKDIKKVDVPQDKFLELFAQKAERNKKNVS